MLLNIGIALLSLIALNFFLLIFSCNKTTKKVKKVHYHKVIKNTEKTTTIPAPVTTKKHVHTQLAPTGS